VQQFGGVLDLGNGTCSLKTNTTKDVEPKVITLTQLPNSSLQKPFLDSSILPELNPLMKPHGLLHTCIKTYMRRFKHGMVTTMTC
jgi:hypothetical protein